MMEETLLQLYWTGIQIDSRMKIYIGKEIALIASWEIFRFYASSLFNTQKRRTNTTGSASMSFMQHDKENFCSILSYH